jgi:hypothetical protein
MVVLWWYKYHNGYVVRWGILTLIDTCSIILPTFGYKCFWINGKFYNTVTTYTYH